MNEMNSKDDDFSGDVFYKKIFNNYDNYSKIIRKIENTVHMEILNIELDYHLSHTQVKIALLDFYVIELAKSIYRANKDNKDINFDKEMSLGVGAKINDIISSLREVDI